MWCGSAASPRALRRSRRDGLLVHNLFDAAMLTQVWTPDFVEPVETSRRRLGLSCATPAPTRSPLWLLNDAASAARLRCGVESSSKYVRLQRQYERVSGLVNDGGTHSPRAGLDVSA
jgi:hypothetical protein